ncbi:MAG: 50S ribosomal protein L30, partial [Anaerolineae bacterium]|nr:50S ribosomal protein L30 [Anaerolineae bacterium]
MAKKKEQVQEKKLKITLVKSSIGFEKSQKETVRSLGLRRLNQTVTLSDNPQIRGMVY